MKDLLIVEDDPTLGEGIRLALQAPELRPQLCRSLADAGELLSRRSFDLLILDINLPDGNGLDLLRALRRESEVPVILLTANDLETDIVAGLELGADDYITKPFSLAVLRARVNTQLRRTAAPQAERVQLDGFTFDFGRMEFSRNGVPVELSKTEQKLLRLLVEHRGQTLTRAALVDRIWTDGAEYVDENALSVTVKRLRDKLEDMPSNTPCWPWRFRPCWQRQDSPSGPACGPAGCWTLWARCWMTPSGASSGSPSMTRAASPPWRPGWPTISPHPPYRPKIWRRRRTPSRP